MKQMKIIKDDLEGEQEHVPGTSPAFSHSIPSFIKSSSTSARHVFCHFLCDSL